MQATAVHRSAATELGMFSNTDSASLKKRKQKKKRKKKVHLWRKKAIRAVQRTGADL